MQAVGTIVPGIAKNVFPVRGTQGGSTAIVQRGLRGKQVPAFLER